ncbi:MAG: SGNH/GDSL hydrolase family protein [Spirochaetes bacterium]|nr:SGNH/GDSL hydrolase family protein [Spirochaetota bacterium]
MSKNAKPMTALDLTECRVLILGDSITDSGAYVSFLDYALLSLYPDRTTDIISAGLSSETASGLSEPAHPFPRPCVHERLSRALTLVRPDVTIACYGMNDGIYHPFSEERFSAYKSGMTKLADAVRNAGSKLLIMTPPPFEAKSISNKVRPASYNNFSYLEPYDGYDDVLARYAAWLMDDTPRGAAVFDLHRAIAGYCEQRYRNDPHFLFTPDGIHPSDDGHVFMARALLAYLGVDKSPLDAPLGETNTRPLFQKAAARRKLRSLGWQRSIGYTRETRVHEDCINATEAEVLRMTNEIAVLRALLRQ